MEIAEGPFRLPTELGDLGGIDREEVGVPEGKALGQGVRGNQGGSGMGRLPGKEEEIGLAIDTTLRSAATMGVRSAVSR